MSKQLSNNISRLQKTHDLSISDLARTFGTSRRTVDRVLGRDKDVQGGVSYHPTPDTLRKIAGAFNVSVIDVTKRLPKFAIESVQPA